MSPVGRIAVALVLLAAGCDSAEPSGDRPGPAPDESAMAVDQGVPGPGTVTVVDVPPECEAVRFAVFSSVQIPDIEDIDDLRAALSNGTFGGGLDASDHRVLHEPEPDVVDVYEVTVEGDARSYVRYWFSRGGLLADSSADCELTRPACARTEGVGVSRADQSGVVSPREALDRVGPPTFSQVPEERILVLPHQRSEEGRRQLEMYGLDETGVATAYAVGTLRPRRDGVRGRGWLITEYGECAGGLALGGIDVADVEPVCDQINGVDYDSPVFPDITDLEGIAAGLDDGTLTLPGDASDRIVLVQSDADEVDAYVVDASGEARTLTTFRVSEGGASLSTGADCRVEEQS